MTNDELLGMLPPEYEPYDKLYVCSVEIRARVPFMRYDLGAPLLIGKGVSPRVWMAMTDSQRPSQLVYVLKDNSPFSPQIQVSAEGGKTVVMTGETVMCSVTRLNENEASVDILDLRPMGLNIFGDSSLLNIGSNKLNGKIGAPSGIAIMLGGPQRTPEKED